MIIYDQPDNVQIKGGRSISTETDRKEMYRKDWQLGGSWLLMANMLKRSADKLLKDYLVAYEKLNDHTTRALTTGKMETFTLDPDIELYCSYMLLMGYALENVIKGMVCLRNRIT
jgi:hypothetical protein